MNKYLLFNWDNIRRYVSDVSELTDAEYMGLVEEDGDNHIYNDEEFESAFNAELFSTATHQLRIIKDE